MQIESIGQLIDAVNYLVAETGYRWWFRGLSSEKHALLPSVRRGYSPDQERYLANEFYARAGTRHSECPAAMDFAGWLSLMQHYGLPTRLMDWSFSPLIAAFFATYTYMDTSANACIWALAPGVLNESQGFEPLLYPLDAGSLTSLLRPALKGGFECYCVVAAMAVENDPRMQMQQGAFTIHSTATPLTAIYGSASWLRKFTIPSRAVPTLKKELALLGMRIDYLFPDLGSLASELKGLIRPMH